MPWAGSCRASILGASLFNPFQRVGAKGLFATGKGAILSRMTIRNNSAIRLAPPPSDDRKEVLAELSRQARYSGNPVHKKAPGDFGLVPPAAPRTNKSLCDAAKIFNRAEALRLLREGIRRGTVSTQEEEGGWPRVVWAVTEKGDILEARSDRSPPGSYHGYPLLPGNPLEKELTRRWKEGGNG